MMYFFKSSLYTLTAPEYMIRNTPKKPTFALDNIDYSPAVAPNYRRSNSK